MNTKYKYEKISDDVYQVTLTNGKTTLINEQDLNLLEVFPSWQYKKGYICCERWIQTEYGNVLQRIYLHKLIVGWDKKWQVDHANRIKHDNRRCNLRMATIQQNGANKISKNKAKSGYRGVYFEPRLKTNPYRITITDKNIRTSKRFKTAEEAATFYDIFAIKTYGDFAVLNFEEKRNEYLKMLNPSV